MKAFQAYGTGCNAVSATPRAAALKFFGMFPTKRKCDVTEGDLDGNFFTISYGRKSEGKWPQQFKDITKKLIHTLPE